MKESYNLKRTANYSYIMFSLHNNVILASFYIVFIILVYQNLVIKSPFGNKYRNSISEL